MQELTTGVSDLKIRIDHVGNENFVLGVVDLVHHRMFLVFTVARQLMVFESTISALSRICKTTI